MRSPRPAATSLSTPADSLPTRELPHARRRGWTPALWDDINLAYADLPILACCVVSGLCDSVAFNAGGVFVSMQTGNTIFLAIGAANLPAGQPLLWLKAFVSIASFWAGCLLFSKSRHFHPQRKATLAISFMVQTVFVLAAAALAQARIVPAFAGASLPSSKETAQPTHDENDMIILLPLALLAFQFGGQIVSSRVLGFNEVPTNVLTSVYCDLLSDPNLLAPIGQNPKRNRRFAAVVLLIVGGIVGGWLQRSRGGMSAPLWIAGAIKLVIALAWLWWNGRTPSSRNEKPGSTP